MLNTNEEIKMGWLLKLYLIINLIINGIGIAGILLFLTLDVDFEKYRLNTVETYYNVSISIIITVAIILIFKWRKSGAYLFGIISIIDFFIILVYEIPISISDLVGRLIGLIVTILAFIYSYKIIDKRCKCSKPNEEIYKDI